MCLVKTSHFDPTAFPKIKNDPRDVVLNKSHNQEPRIEISGTSPGAIYFLYSYVNDWTLDSIYFMLKGIEDECYGVTSGTVRMDFCIWQVRRRL